MRIVTYLDRSLSDVVAGFERPDADEIVGAGVEGVLGDRLDVHVGRPVWLTRRSVLVPVRWRDRLAAVQLVVVQSGATPKTEAVVVLEGDDIDAGSAHRLVDAVTERLVAA